MRFYYTGGEALGAIQTNPYKSLGGFISGANVGENINSLFSEISHYTKSSKTPQVRCIGVYNDTGIDLVDVKLWIESITSIDIQTKYKIGFVTPNSQGQLELLSTESDLPSTVKLIEVSELNPLIIPSFPKDSYIGLFIARYISVNQYDAENIPIEEIHKIVVEYDNGL